MSSTFILADETCSYDTQKVTFQSWFHSYIIIKLLKTFLCRLKFICCGGDSILFIVMLAKITTISKNCKDDLNSGSLLCYVPLCSRNPVSAGARLLFCFLSPPQPACLVLKDLTETDVNQNNWWLIADLSGHALTHCCLCGGDLLLNLLLVGKYSL